MAIGSATFTDIAGGISDLFAADAHRMKAQGDAFEKQNYQLAAQLASQNADFAAMSTNIKQAQVDRELFTSLGATKAAVAGAGLAESGSAEDILAQSAREGALTRAVTGEQGLIQEAGYKEQAQSYQNMAQAAQVAIDAENRAATASEITAGIKGIAAIATLL